MRVGIAGAGAIAMGYAGFLQRAGHCPLIWSPSGRSAEPFSNGADLKLVGAVEGSFSLELCETLEKLVEPSVIILALPAYGHKLVLDELAPLIRADHTVIIGAHLSFAALYISCRLAERGIVIPIIAWNTTALTCKKQSPTEFRVGAIRSKVGMATVPSRLVEQALATCVELFGNRFEPKEDILTITLSNLNPQSHLAIALCNLTRIERGETWGQNTNTTPSVHRLLDALDQERVAVAAAFGKSVKSRSELRRLSAPPSNPVSEPNGPKDMSTRYVLEDVPFGLLPMLRLAKLSGVPVPLHESGVGIFNACYGRDLGEDNDLLTAIEMSSMEKLMALVENGYPILDDKRH